MKRHRLDARGLPCPQPIIEAQKALEDMGLNQTLEILCTDPGSEIDFRAFCRANGHELVRFREAPDGVFQFILRKKA